MTLIHAERPADGSPEGLLILHHGRGSDENDLLALADVLDPGRRPHRPQSPYRPRPQRPGDRSRIRPPGTRPAGGGRPRARLPRIRSRPSPRPARPAARGRVARHHALVSRYRAVTSTVPAITRTMPASRAALSPASLTPNQPKRSTTTETTS